MAISEQQCKRQCTEEFHGQEEEDYTENGGSDTKSYVSDDSQDDPTFDILEETKAEFSRLSIKKKSKARIAKDMDMGSVVDPEEVEMVVPELDEKDEKSFQIVQKIIEAGQVEKLKVDQCKVYLRKNGLRLTGNKDTLVQRIKEHLEIINGGGEKKYPVSSFVLNCKGDACTGDVVMFEQNVYEMFSIASRRASGPPCGTRIVAGRIVKESYGAAKQQHTFTIEVLWSKGEKQLPPLHPLLIKGRNLYRLKTLRQRWEDEGERQKALREKHSRGSLARSDREVRVQEKEIRKMCKVTRVPRKEDPNSNQNQMQNNHQYQIPIQHSRPTIPTFQSHPNLTKCWNYNSTSKENIIHFPQASNKFFSSSNTEKPFIGLQEAKHHRGDEFHANLNDPRSLLSGLSERVHHRQPLTSMNHPWQRQGHTHRQLCRYYAQGRCHFGDNCKFLHELREECAQRREER